MERPGAGLPRGFGAGIILHRPRVFEIETFTAEPDVAEDRIRLNAASAQGGDCSIWLTRRLADRFLPNLVAAIEQDARSGLPREIELAMSQQHLRMERDANPVEDVVPAPGRTPWLCQTIHLETSPDHMVWTLTDDAQNSAVMVLPGDAPRAVLDIFLLMYRQLEWGEQPFPAWLTDAQTPDAGSHLLN